MVRRVVRRKCEDEATAVPVGERRRSSRVAGVRVAYTEEGEEEEEGRRRGKKKRRTWAAGEEDWKIGDEDEEDEEEEGKRGKRRRKTWGAGGEAWPIGDGAMVNRFVSIFVVRLMNLAALHSLMFTDLFIVNYCLFFAHY